MPFQWSNNTVPEYDVGVPLLVTDRPTLSWMVQMSWNQESGIIIFCYFLATYGYQNSIFNVDLVEANCDMIYNAQLRIVPAIKQTL